MGLVVGDKLDEELAAGGDDRGWRDFPAKLSQHGRRLIAAIVNFHIVVPVGESEEMHVQIYDPAKQQQQLCATLTLNC